MDRKDVMLETQLPTRNPYTLFDLWFQEALNDPSCYEPNAMCISTVSTTGQPSSRYVLLKSYSPSEGFTFFTNYESRKAQELAANPKICTNFYWFPLKKQIRIEGTVTKVSAAESEAYFYERPRDSQIGAKVSEQSQRIVGRHVLDDNEKQLRASLADGDKIPMPNWGGYKITPHLFEFWQGQSNRIHDRLVFRRAAPGEENVGDDQLTKPADDGWVLERLAP